VAAAFTLDVTGRAPLLTLSQASEHPALVVAISPPAGGPATGRFGAYPDRDLSSARRM